MRNWKFEYHENLEGNCFVYVQGNEADMQKYFDLVRLSKDDKVILYPERAMTLVDTVCYQPFVKSVVTENPWIISCYKRDNVWILEEGRWINPDCQTFGASVNFITLDILNVHGTIPLIVMTGKKGITEFKEKVRKNDFKR